MFKYAYEDLVTSPEAIQYLKSRKITSKQVDLFRIGYIKYNYVLSDLTRVTDDKQEEPLKLYRGSLLFPLLDEYGELVGVLLRNLTPSGTQNPYTKIIFNKFDPLAKKFLCGLYQSLDYVYTSKTILLTEGIFDMLAVQRYFPATAAILTANVSQEQKSLLKRYVDKILYVPDNDKTGRKASINIKKYFSDSFRITTLEGYAYKDYSEWLKNDPKGFEVYFQDLKTIFL